MLSAAVDECHWVGRRMRRDGWVYGEDTEGCRSTGDSREGRLRSKGGQRRGSRGGCSDQFVFFHQRYQSQIRPYTMRETAYSPPNSTVPAMPNCRESVSAREGDGGSRQRRTALPRLTESVDWADVHLSSHLLRSFSILLCILR